MKDSMLVLHKYGRSFCNDFCAALALTGLMKSAFQIFFFSPFSEAATLVP